MRISDWSSDVCSSDLIGEAPVLRPVLGGFDGRLGRESGGQRRERGPEGGALFPHLRRLFGPERGAVATQPAAGVEQRGDRKNGVQGKGVSVRADPGGSGKIKQTKQQEARRKQ